jgi:hypothetical protein
MLREEIKQPPELVFTLPVDTVDKPIEIRINSTFIIGKT